MMGLPSLPFLARVYCTRFGRLTTNAVNGDVPRDLGPVPITVRFDANLQSGFQTELANAEQPHYLTSNVRSANLLNHTNVTALGTIISSPNSTLSLAAETARRVELAHGLPFERCTRFNGFPP